jgi:cytochrome c553
VRAMVAFLDQLPHLDAEQYRRLVYGDEPAIAPSGTLPNLEPQSQTSVVASCARCHGAEGQGRGNAAFPKLAGQRRQYLLAQLEAFAHDRRHSGIMQPIAAGLSSDERRAAADHYSRLPAASDAADDARARAESESGWRIASEGIPNQGIPSCVDCHGPGHAARNAAYPRLAGQYTDYLVLQLELFKEGRRGGSPYAHLMARVAARLTAEQMQSVARYYASLDGPP